MTLYKIRDYQNLINRLKTATNIYIKEKFIGTISSYKNNYPLLKLYTEQNNSRCVLISVKIHRNEPAGIESICSF